MESVRHSLKPTRATFELFGYDFIIDSDFGTYLIEVNTNPCLEESSPLLEALIPRMINDLLRLTIDQVFWPRKGQPPYDPKELNVFEVPGYDIQENMWSHLVNLVPPATQTLPHISKRQDRSALKGTSAPA